jgi:starch phosphorylase
LEAGATQNVPLDGYGIRYRYGLFSQWFEDGFQRESGDAWQNDLQNRHLDRWSIRRDEDRVLVAFTGGDGVHAVPYDMPIIGYGGKTVNTLRLWQAEPLADRLAPSEFAAFNRGDYAAAFHLRNEAEAINAVLYPDDSTDFGKRLRLRQEYFLASASMQSMLKRVGNSPEQIAERFAVQLNDTHPTLAIPELLRLLIEEHTLDFESAFGIAHRTFAYTNHTVMAEALERWNIDLLASALPRVYPYIVMLSNRLNREYRGVSVRIIAGNNAHMANMAAYVSHSVNGVSELHTELLKTGVLADWYSLYPQRFNNKTNGVTPRRWLGMCNPLLAEFVTRKLGSSDWLCNLERLRDLAPLADDHSALQEFAAIKLENKRRLLNSRLEGLDGLSDSMMFDVQIKRVHEYKRQLLAALALIDTYLALKNGGLPDYAPTATIFSGKAAPSYSNAKAIIKLINEIARITRDDADTRELLRVFYVPDYSVSVAELIVPAADVSEQISTAGFEASGTGNMKLALNGAVTLGTHDGANVEIFREAGLDVNYPFGATPDEIRALEPTYKAREYYLKNPRINRALNALVDGTFSDGGTGMFRALFDSLVNSHYGGRADKYFVLHDFESYTETRARVNLDFRDTESFARKQFLNFANAGKFSADRTVLQYAREIWRV